MNCPSCGHENPDRAKFCLECGGAFSLRCPSCETELPAAAKFCLECGTRAAAPAEAAERAPTDYTPRHLADRILRSRSALEGERKQVTVLFADVKGSMEITGDQESMERISPEVHDWLAADRHLSAGLYPPLEDAAPPSAWLGSPSR